MRKVLSLLLVMSLVFAPLLIRTETVNAATSPVTVYNDSYSGTSRDLSVGSYDYSSLYSWGMNDSITSIKVASGYKVTLCADPNYTGTSRVFLNNYPDMSVCYFNDTVSSIKVETFDITSCAAVVYYDNYYAGPALILNTGDYNYSILNSLGFNDSIGSVRVNPGYKALLYNHPDFNSGREFVTSYDDLADCGMSDSVSSIKVQSTGEAPVFLCSDSDYTGTCQPFGIGSYNMNQLWFNDGASSIYIAPGYKVTLYSDDNFSGVSQVFVSSYLYLGDSGLDDTVSSIKVEAYNPSDYPVIAFRDFYFTGPAQLFTVGNYDIGQLAFNDNISSIKIVPGYKATVYADSAYTGNSRVLKGEISELDSYNGWNQINDAISSLKVETSTTTNTFSVISVNVHGILTNSNDADTRLIGNYLNDYDMAAVQEDFNYHAALYEGCTVPFRTPTSGGAGIGDGMNFVSKFPFADTDRETWIDRYGVFDCGSDELTPKGFMYNQVEVEPGVYIDVYTLHADADTDPNSEAARNSNMSQLASYINTYSKGHAVIVFGDTNNRYTRSADLFETLLVQPCGLTDVWVELVRGGSVPADDDANPLTDGTDKNGPNYEVVDKIFYRSSPELTLNATSFRLEDTKFVDSNGEALTDHYPVAATFRYTKNSDLTLSQLWGGPGGIAFDSLDSTAPISSKPTVIGIQSQARVDGISMTYQNGTKLSYGAIDFSNERTLTLASDEYVKQVTVYRDTKDGYQRVYYVEFLTNKGNILSGGTKTGDKMVLTAPEGSYVAGFFGRAEASMDKLGIISKVLPLPGN